MHTHVYNYVSSKDMQLLFRIGLFVCIVCACIRPCADVCLHRCVCIVCVCNVRARMCVHRCACVHTCMHVCMYMCVYPKNVIERTMDLSLYGRLFLK